MDTHVFQNICLMIMHMCLFNIMKYIHLLHTYANLLIWEFTLQMWTFTCVPSFKYFFAQIHEYLHMCWDGYSLMLLLVLLHMCFINVVTIYISAHVLNNFACLSLQISNFSCDFTNNTCICTCVSMDIHIWWYGHWPCNWVPAHVFLSFSKYKCTLKSNTIVTNWYTSDLASMYDFMTEISFKINTWK